MPCAGMATCGCGTGKSENDQFGCKPRLRRHGRCHGHHRHPRAQRRAGVRPAGAAGPPAAARGLWRVHCHLDLDAGAGQLCRARLCRIERTLPAPLPGARARTPGAGVFPLRAQGYPRQRHGAWGHGAGCRPVLGRPHLHGPSCAAGRAGPAVPCHRILSCRGGAQLWLVSPHHHPRLYRAPHPDRRHLPGADPVGGATHPAAGWRHHGHGRSHHRRHGRRARGAAPAHARPVAANPRAPAPAMAARLAAPAASGGAR